jgi:dTMP kinase
MRGVFITFEGPDGSGKTTQIRLLAEYLNAKGYPVVMTREPGGTKISEDIRTIILDPENKEMDDMTEALLYAAARAQHVAQLIKPSVEEGKIVLSDRFMDSSIAYQGYGRELGDKIRIINEYAVAGMHPDLTFFLDLSAEAGISRANKRQKLDRLEQESIAFHKKVYEGYLELSKIYSDRYVIIDASRSIEEISKDIVGKFEEYIKNREDAQS